MRSRLSLYVALTAREKRHVFLHQFHDQRLQVRIPTRLGREDELYMALTYIGRPVFSETVLDMKENLTVHYQIGEVTSAQFEVIDGLKNMILAVKVADNLVTAFETLSL